VSYNPLNDGDAREHADLESNKDEARLHKGVSHGLTDSFITDEDIDDFIEDALPGDDV